MSFGAILWRGATSVFAPSVPFYLRWRVRKGKEVADRLPERFGEGATRPAGPLLWLHAASVGEMLSALPLIEALLAQDAALEILVTTGTVTSARLLGQRLPDAIAPRVRHRYAPLDVPRWAARFLDGWQPDPAVFIESELWPNLIAAARRRGIPLALVNGRMSERSARGWRWVPGLARGMLLSFRLVLGQTEADRARLAALGAADAQCWGNLKDAAPPLPVDAAALARLRGLMAGRKVFLAASTHPGEETIVAAAHEALLAAHPGLLTILVPRHPERGEAIARALAARHPAGALAARHPAGALAARHPARALAARHPARRAAGAEPAPGTGLYIADTLGELGLFYRLADVAFVGGSLVPHGGQNPLEPARLGCPILLGPHSWNFAEPVARLLEAGGAIRVEPGTDPADALARAVEDVLSSPDRGQAMAGAADAVAAGEAALPSRIAAALLLLLPGRGCRDGAPPGRGQSEGRTTVEA